MGSNRNHLISFSNWLAPVAKGVYSLWKRCWRASVDGWASSTSHSRCDVKGPTVAIIRVGKYMFGGYTSISWGKLLLLSDRHWSRRSDSRARSSDGEERVTRRKRGEKREHHQNGPAFGCIDRNDVFAFLRSCSSWNLFPGLPLVSMHLTSGLISKVSIRTNVANYTWFHL